MAAEKAREVVVAHAEKEAAEKAREVVVALGVKVKGEVI